jgi:nitrogen fixation NifU-like protein
MDSLYRENILEHYRQPHHHGTLAAPDVHVDVDNPLCGDRLSLDVQLAEGTIADVAFTGRGCAISQASASILSDELVGMPVAEAAQLRQSDLLELLGVDIGPARLKCALLALKGLKMALIQAGVPVSSYVDDDDHA